MGLATVSTAGDAAAAGALVALAAAWGTAAVATRQLFNRRRMAAWEADWLATAPAWNRQRW
jgi:hypothetical protein